MFSSAIYTYGVWANPSVGSFCSYNLQLLRNMCEIVCICFWHKLALVGLLDEILVPLLVSKVDGIFLGLELNAMAVHEVGRGLPAHERILPSVAFGKDIPVHEPVRRVPVAGLCSSLCGAVYAVGGISGEASMGGRHKRDGIPHGACLEINGSTREHRGGDTLTGLAAIHDTLGDGGEVAARALG